MIRESVRDHALGALLGQCCGDALGCRYHYRNASDVCQQIQADRDADAFLPLLGSAVFDFAPGQVGDGSEFCMLLARSFCRRLAVSVPDIAEAILRWKRSDPIGIHNPIFDALEIDSENDDPQINAVQMEKKITLNALRKNKTSLSNICLNAAAPIAIVSVMSTNASHHINTLATRITRLTQPHPAAVDAVRVLATAIRSLVLSPDSQLAFDSALKAARTPLVREHLTQSRVRPHPQPENELDDSELPIDYIGITLQNAFYHLRHARSYSEGVIAAIQGGGDTTTNAAVTGALLGARFGVNGIPSAWKNTCVKTRLDRHNVFPDVQLSDLSEVVHRLISKVSL